MNGEDLTEKRGNRKVEKINLNTLFNRLINFKIGFRKNPTPIQIGNKDLIFVTENREGRIYGHRTFLFLKRITWNETTDVIEIVLE